MIKRFMLLLALCFAFAGCDTIKPATIHQPREVCKAHNGVKNVQIYDQGYTDEKQDTLCNDGYLKVEPE